jgi:hypothetical protein
LSHSFAISYPVNAWALLLYLGLVPTVLAYPSSVTLRELELRLIIQPTLALSLIFPWLDLFPNHNLLLGFHDLIHAMNQFQPFFPDG